MVIVDEFIYLGKGTGNRNWPILLTETIFTFLKRETTAAFFQRVGKLL
jgi:hypothetical protein